MKRWKIAAAAVLAMGLSMGMSAGVYAQEKEYSNGKKAEGVWISGKQQGPGRIPTKNGNELEGFLCNDSLEGGAICYNIDGSRYIYTFYDGLTNGIGLAITKDNKVFPLFYEDGKQKESVTVNNWEGTDGTLYYARKKEDLMDGKGIAIYPFENTIYVGEFKNLKREGWGTLFYPNKDRYIGEWKNDTMDGPGFYAYPKFSYYLYKSGIWTKGKCQGGVYYYSSRDTILIGTETDDLLQGTIAQINADGTTSLYEYKDGKPSGKSKIYTDKEGNQFVGVKKGKTGSGLKLSKSGTVSIGNFRDGLPNGQVFTFWPDSLIMYDGVCEAGKRTAGTLFWPYGRSYAGTYREDKSSSFFIGRERDFRALADGVFSETSNFSSGTYTRYYKDGSCETKTYKKTQ